MSDLSTEEKLRREALLEKLPTVSEDGEILMRPWQGLEKGVEEELKDCLIEYREKMKKGRIVSPHGVTVATAMNMEKIVEAVRRVLIAINIC